MTQALSGAFLAAVALLAGLRAIDGQPTIGGSQPPATTYTTDGAAMGKLMVAEASV